MDGETGMHDVVPAMDAGTVRFRVEGMSCAGCVGNVEKALAGVPRVDRVSVNLATGLANVGGNAALADLLAAVEKAAITLSPMKISRIRKPWPRATGATGSSSSPRRC